ncbi:hypothetical protein EYF80_002064 [Liparis tanakae]|uniref:Uncharacterized protein n=1 Tax=Liparis tanakae TaxID=230148 RepID=A0A4Z2JCJ7_9TELE|nr:hypothetical protein EYF80_002064 [Liparis tanakae]
MRLRLLLQASGFQVTSASDAETLFALSLPGALLGSESHVCRIVRIRKKAQIHSTHNREAVVSVIAVTWQSTGGPGGPGRIINEAETKLWRNET